MPPIIPIPNDVAENGDDWATNPVELSTALGELLDYPPDFDGLDGTFFSQTNNIDSIWPSEPNPDSCNSDDQKFKQISTMEAIEGHSYKGNLESTLSLSSGSSLPNPYIDAHYTRLLDTPLKNEEENGAQWEHVEDITLELNSDEDVRRHSLDSLRTGPVPSTDREAIQNNRSKSATHAELLKPRRRRGRKPSNLSPEEKRRRRLERGRLAANKCRRKKRELENMLEDRAKSLLAERNTMLKINNELRVEMQGLIDEVMSHSNGACAGIPKVTDLLANPPQSQKVTTDFEQTYSSLCPPQPTHLNTPCLSKTITACPLEPLNLDPSPQDEMMDILFPGQM